MLLQGAVRLCGFELQASPANVEHVGIHVDIHSMDTNQTNVQSVTCRLKWILCKGQLI